MDRLVDVGGYRPHSISKDVLAESDASTAIKNVIAGYVDSWNRHDAYAASMSFAEDGDFINVEQAVFRGRKGIEEHLVPMFAGRLKNAHRTYTVKSIRFLTPQVAVVYMDYEITGTKGIDGADVALRKGLYDCVVTGRNGKWLINVLQESEH
jgi:uncharacterized protein (TIGR02246 family)